jgi:ribosomal protein L18
VKNIQIIDGAVNATFSIFQATEDEFAVIFPDGRDMEIAGDLVERVGEEVANRALTSLWQRPVLKRDAAGIHGTLFYDAEERREFMPTSMREVDWNERFINEAQRNLFRQHR